jgi:ABC-type Zn uptake system ZnuABC Zn-binding protein ZnuA
MHPMSRSGFVNYPWLLLPAVFALVLALAACGSNTPAGQEATPTTQPAADAATPTVAQPTAEEEVADESAMSAEDTDHDDEHAEDADHDDEHAEGEEHDHAEGEEHEHAEGEEHEHAEGEEHEHAEGEEHDHDHAGESASIDELVAALQPIEEGETLNVVATTNIVGDVVRQVGGDAINLTTLMPVGADPHSFEPTPQEVGTIADADVVFVNGFELEEAVLGVIENSGIAPERIIPVSVGVETIEFGADEAHDHDHEGEEHDHEGKEHDHEGEEHDHEGEEHSDETQGSNLLDLFATTAYAHEGDEHDHDHDHSGVDPHIWMSPVNVMVWTDNIAAILAALDPANANTYTDNAASYTAELEELASWIDEQIAQIPEENRELVTDHTAFGYYAYEYGLEQVGAVVPAYSTLAETSAQELAELQDTITELDVPAVFVGTTVNPDLAEQVAADMGVQLLPIYTGSLSEADGPATSYIEMMRYNTEQFVTGLSG